MSNNIRDVFLLMAFRKSRYLNLKTMHQKVKSSENLDKPKSRRVGGYPFIRNTISALIYLLLKISMF